MARARHKASQIIFDPQIKLVIFLTIIYHVFIVVLKYPFTILFISNQVFPRFLPTRFEIFQKAKWLKRGGIQGFLNFLGETFPLGGEA